MDTVPMGTTATNLFRPSETSFKATARRADEKAPCAQRGTRFGNRPDIDLRGGDRSGRRAGAFVRNTQDQHAVGADAFLQIGADKREIVLPEPGAQQGGERGAFGIGPLDKS